MRRVRVPILDAETKAEVKRVAGCPGKFKCQHCRDDPDDTDMSGESHDCPLCGDHYYLDYEDMK